MYYYRFVVLVHAMVAILLGVSAKAGISSALIEFGVSDTAIGGVVTASGIAALLLAIVEFVVVMRTVSVLTFTDEVLAEIMRVTWPTRDESFRAASTVIMTVSIMAMVISCYDLLWKQLANLILFNHS